MGKLKRCVGFGSAFDESSDVCMVCENAVECMNKMIEDDLDRREGKKPPIVFGVSRNTSPPIMLQFTESTPDNIGFKIFFNKEWLRKRLEHDKK